MPFEHTLQYIFLILSIIWVIVSIINAFHPIEKLNNSCPVLLVIVSLFLIGSSYYIISTKDQNIVKEKTRQDFQNIEQNLGNILSDFSDHEEENIIKRTAAFKVLREDIESKITDLKNVDEQNLNLGLTIWRRHLISYHYILLSRIVETLDSSRNVQFADSAAHYSKLSLNIINSLKNKDRNETESIIYQWVEDQSLFCNGQFILSWALAQKVYFTNQSMFIPEIETLINRIDEKKSSFLNDGEIIKKNLSFKRLKGRFSVTFRKKYFP